MTICLAVIRYRGQQRVQRQRRKEREGLGLGERLSEVAGLCIKDKIDKIPCSFSLLLSGGAVQNGGQPIPRALQLLRDFSTKLRMNWRICGECVISDGLGGDVCHRNFADADPCADPSNLAVPSTCVQCAPRITASKLDNKK